MSLQASILAVGDEVLSGDVVNSNAAYLSKHLTEMGIEVTRHCVVSDQVPAIQSALQLLLESSDIVLLSGGLGPTKDDITKEVVASTLGLAMEYSDQIEDELKELFQKHGYLMTENNKRQCYIPQTAEVMPNHHGTAPGIYLSYHDKIIALMPGPPKELQPMFEAYIKPRIAEKIQKVIVEKSYMTSGIGESPLEQLLRDHIEETGYYYYNTYITKSGVMVKAIGRGENKASAQSQIERHDEAMKSVLGTHLYSEMKQELWEFLGTMMIKHNITLSAAESCTGGLFSSYITQVPGISSVFRGGVIAYDNAIKQNILGVQKETLDVFGAVSEETACEMAKGVCDRFATDCGIGITGVAGPGGGSEEKPVGLVWICLFYKGECYTRKNIFRGNRTTIQQRSAIAVMQLFKEVVFDGLT